MLNTIIARLALRTTDLRTFKAASHHGLSRNTSFRSRSTSTTSASKLCASTSDPQASSIDYHREDLYSFTRGRFVANEDQEMAMRYRHFNATELESVAAQTTGCRSCVKLEKYADGLCNKVFTLTMDDGNVVFAKISHPNAGQPHYITASEVATMEYMREILQTPVPRVLAWCSRAEQTPVEAEYIIMEAASGAPLEKFYRNMDVSDRYAVLQAIAEYQKTWTNVSFEGHGSLYYTKDLAAEDRIEHRNDGDDCNGASKYSIGPSTARDWYEDEKVCVEFDRGPWSSAALHLEAVGHREMTCVKHAKQLPFSSPTLYGPGTHRRCRKKKAQATQHYLALLHDIMPREDAVKQPCLWHADLHAANIFVDPQKPTTVTSIIDWQSVDIAPLFVQIRQPPFLDYEGPQVKGLERPKLPENYHRLPPDEKAQARTLHTLSSLSALYRFWLHVHNPAAWKGMHFQESPAHNLLLFARKLFTDGEAMYMAKLLDLGDSQPEALGGSAPTFTAVEKAEITSDAEAAVRGMDLMSGIIDTLGDLFPGHGILARPVEYDEVRDALRQMKEQVIEQYATTEEEQRTWKKVWPWGG